MEIVECACAHFIEDGSTSHRDIVFEEVLDDVTPVTQIDVSIFLAPPNTSVDQNPDPMPDVDEDFEGEYYGKIDQDGQHSGPFYSFLKDRALLLSTLLLVHLSKMMYVNIVIGLIRI